MKVNSKKCTILVRFIRLTIGFLISVLSVKAQPSEFQDQLKVKGGVVDGLLNTIGISFDAVGQMYACESNGKVWALRFAANGTLQQKYLMLDISNEVLTNGDLGLVSMVLDPDFLTSGYFYIMYAVNRQFLLDGTDGGDGSDQTGSIVRVTRYTADINASPSFTTILPNSRLVLIGTSPSDGIPIISTNHGGGSLVFGSDGTLLISTGDGSVAGTDQGNQGNYTEAISAGVITAAHNIGAYRSQLDDSPNGKILRINPANGDGIASNPLYNAAAPRAAESRLWAKGLRNPFKMNLIPSTGSHHPEDGDPGILLVGDVGNVAREEINTVTGPNQNFGWPHFEGIDQINLNYSDSTYWPASYRKPIFEYRDEAEAANVYLNQSTKIQIGSPEFPYSGPAFTGNSTMGGVFYTGTAFPAAFQNAIFLADFGEKWIRVLKLNSNYEPESIDHFMSTTYQIVHLAYNSSDQALYYLTGEGLPCDEIHCLSYTTGNIPPIAKIEVDATAGMSPFPVAFTALKSYDPEATSLTYEWEIENSGTFSTGLSPHYVFTAPANIRKKIKIKLTVKDNEGAAEALSSSDSVYIYFNNTPPSILSTSLDGLTQIPEGQSYPLTFSAVVSDADSPTDSLTLSWIVGLAHNGHEHRNSPLIGNSINTSLDALTCEVGDATYWYRIHLTVTDPQGLSTTFLKEIQVACSGAAQAISLNPIENQTITLNTTAALTASASSSAGITPINYFITSGPGYVIGNTVTLTGKPGKVGIRATQHGNATYQPAPPVERTFDVNRAITEYSLAFSSIPDKQATDAPFVISGATTPSEETVQYLLISGPATLAGNVVTLTGDGGTVRLRAYYQGTYTQKGAYAEQTFEVFCPTTYTLTAPILTGQTKTFEAGQVVTATNQLASGANVVYRAGAAVYLEPGFLAEQGSVFLAETGGCNPAGPAVAKEEKIK